MKAEEEKERKRSGNAQKKVHLAKQGRKEKDGEAPSHGVRPFTVLVRPANAQGIQSRMMEGQKKREKAGCCCKEAQQPHITALPPLLSFFFLKWTCFLVNNESGYLELKRKGVQSSKGRRVARHQPSDASSRGEMGNISF